MAHHFMKRFTPQRSVLRIMAGVLVMTAGFCLATRVFAFADEPPAKSEVVAMDRFVVGNHDYFEITCRFKADDKEKIFEAKLIWLLPYLEKTGPHKGDRLISIDGKKVEGMSLAELKALLDFNLAIGATRTFSFEGKRGLWGKRVFPEIVFTGVDNKNTESSPSPVEKSPGSAN